MRRIENHPGRNKGMSLHECIVVVAVIGIVVAVGVPELGDLGRAAALRSASIQIEGLLFRCRAYAVMNSRFTAAVFEQLPDGSWRCFIAVDGDGDGVRTRDIRSSIDPVVGQLVHFENGHAGLGILQNERVPDPSGRGRLGGNLGDPVRAGRGNMISFTPRGTASPASLYFTDHRTRMRVLRVYGGSSRVRSLVWRSGWPAWRKTGL